jgi:hypothetical protein
MNNYYVTFFSHYDALVFHKFLKEKGIAAKLMPTPRKLSASCGNCVYFSVPSDVFDEIDLSGFEVGEVYVL